MSSTPLNSFMGWFGLWGIEVVACYKLKDTELISRQDPYVCLEYASTKFRTRTCTDGGKNPTFQEKFLFSLIEGLSEIEIIVCNKNVFTSDDFIGSGRAQLHKVVSHGYDDTAWPLHTKTGRYAGEVKLIMHFPNALNHQTPSYSPAMPPYIPSYPPTTYPPYPSITPPQYPVSSLVYPLPPLQQDYSTKPYPAMMYAYSPPPPPPPQPQPYPYCPPGSYLGAYPPPY